MLWYGTATLIYIHASTVLLIKNLIFILKKTALASIEESIQRVNGPLPKRKTFEFQLENRKYSYQDAFLKFLAGEKQPSLDIISEQINRKPKDNFYISSKSGKQNSTSATAATTASSGLTTTATTTNNGSIIAIASTNNNNSVIATAASYVDKENYYNASRRENLLPVNSYEYRNSYKDHYDHQGVRVNPAILKALPQELQQTLNAPVTGQQQQQQIVARNSAPSSATNKNNLINDVSQLLNYPQNSVNGKLLHHSSKCFCLKKKYFNRFKP